jgi:tight adherence protein B
MLLYRAGMPTTPLRFVLFTLLMGAFGYLTLTVLADPVRGSLGVLAGFVPWLLVRSMASRRMRRFEEQLPEGLELLTRSLRAGHGLGSGFHLVGEEMEDPIGTEFGIVAEEVRFGLDLRDALDNLTRRVDNQDLPYFTTAVLIQRQTGGNLAELLDKLSSLVRERAQFYGKVRALTAQGRGAAAFLACWLPFISGVVWYTSPNYLEPLFENAWGHLVIAAAVAMDISGYIIARRIADVQA